MKSTTELMNTERSVSSRSVTFHIISTRMCFRRKPNPKAVVIMVVGAYFSMTKLQLFSAHICPETIKWMTNFSFKTRLYIPKWQSVFIPRQVNTLCLVGRHAHQSRQKITVKCAMVAVGINSDPCENPVHKFTLQVLHGRICPTLGHFSKTKRKNAENINVMY